MIHSELIYARRYGFRPLALDLHVPDGVDRPPLVVWIHGGGFTSRRVLAAVGWYPMTDIAALDLEFGGLPYSPWLGGVPSQMPDVMTEANPITYVDVDSPPCMLVHGELDSVYPPSRGELMHQRLVEAGVESVCRIVPAVGHGLTECSREAAAALLDKSVAFLRDRI